MYCRPVYHLVLVVSLAMVMQAVTGGGISSGPGRYCLACICSAASGCDLNVGCQQDNGITVCGPFFITRPFWLDANVTGTFKNYEYPTCANDVQCVAETVRSYMANFSRDCDGDGRVTCRDYGLMHWMGYGQCTEPTQRWLAEHTPFFRTFTRCLQDVDQLLVAGRRPPPQLPVCTNHNQL